MNNTIQDKIAIDYWLERTTGYEPSEIGTPTGAVAHQSELSFVPDEETVTAIKKISNDQDAGIYVLMLAALHITFYKYTSVESQLIACAPPVMGENDAPAPLFLGARVESGMLVKELMLHLQNELKEGYQHRAYSFEKFKEKHTLLYGPADPLLDHSFSYVPLAAGVQSFSAGAKLAFAIHRMEGAFKIVIRYDGRYEKGFIQRLGEHYLHIAGFIARHAAEKIGAVPFMSVEEKQYILEGLNDTVVDFADKDMPIIAQFERAEREHPEQVAVRYDGKDLSYRDLRSKVLTLASLLRSKGVGRGSIVALVCDRSAHMIVGMFGVLKAGAAYLPIDPENPDERIAYILEDSKTQIILTTKNVLASKPEFFKQYEGVLVLDEIEVDEGIADIAITHAPDDPAYIIYTSGSTGQPKGIIILHKGFINLVLAFKSRHINRFNTTDRCLALANIAFDASVAEIYMCLTSGSTLVVLDKERLFDPEKLADFIVEEGISVAYIPPVLLKDLYTRLKVHGSEAIRLNKLFVGVEAIKDSLLYDYCSLIKGLDILNCYGPTETTVICSAFSYIPASPVGENVSIGKPIPNYRIYIVNDVLESLPMGVVGEICVAGPGVAQCYLNNEELTAAKFLADPFHKGERMFRTGDLAKWTQDGNIQFIGRKDNQVKIRGYRVELGEIESVLLNHPQIKEAVVCAYQDGVGSKYLYTYFTRKTLSAPEGLVEVLRDYLGRLLPDYMIPSGFMELERIPMTSNGKTDRRRLPHPASIEKPIEDEDRPSTELEKKLAATWQELLNIPQVGVNANFFELGGQSLKAAKLITIILRDHHVEVPLKQIFISGTISRLAEYIQQAASSVLSEIPIAPVADHYPASFAQRRLYLSYLLDKKALNYNIPVAYRIEGRLDRERFEQAFQTVIRRQGSLRMGFALIDGVVVQKVSAEVDFTVSFEKKASGDQLPDFVQPFDLGVPPLLRVSIVQHTVEAYTLMLDMHHIISDGVSVGLLLEEFTQAYHAVSLPPLRIQYTDYSSWLHAYRGTADFAQQKGFWLTSFADKQESVRLPLDHPRPDDPTFAGDSVAVMIDKSGLKALADQASSTLFLVSFAAYYALLYKYSGQNDIVVGTPVSGRIHPDLDGILGMFVNTLPVRNKLNPRQSFTKLLQQLKDVFFKALDNQLYPMEELIADLDLERMGSRNPLFDSLFSFQNFESRDLQIEGLSIEGVGVDTAAAKFDLTIEIQETEKELVIAFVYSTDLFERPTIERMVGHYLTVLKHVAESPDGAVGDICLMSPQEWKDLSAVNDTQIERIYDTIPQMFEAQVAAVPDALALSGAGISMTYAELNKKANALAMILMNQGLKKEDVVAVLAEKNATLIIGLLAIFKAGTIFLPIDPKHPLDRMAFILEDAGCACLLNTIGEIPEAVREMIVEKGIRILESGVGQVGDKRGASPEVGEDRGERIAGGGVNAEERVGGLPTVLGTDAAYIIYTSGSTGRPKGVIVEHRSITNYTIWANRYCLPQQRAGAMPLFTPVSFDLTLTAIFTPLTTGNELVIYNGGEEGLLIEKIMADNSVDAIKLTPSHVSIMNNVLPETMPTDLRDIVLIVGGEAFASRLAKDVNQRSNGKITILNEYGPTETTVGCTIYPFSPEEKLAIIPLGMPIDNTRIYLLDSDDQPCPVGVTGEICIAGEGLARGYINRQELTAIKFTHVASLPEKRIYRTGDLGRRLPDGNLIFGGRRDEQLKINGYRIEPGEIAAVLRRNDAITEAMVLPFEQGQGKTLIAYFTAIKPMGTPELKAFLEDQLPSYMVPTWYMQIDSFPLTGNGKVNKQALPQPVAEAPMAVLPDNEMEARLLKIWSAVLETDRVGVTDNFFISGGHSLKALVLVSRIQKSFHIEVSLKDIFNHPTVRTLTFHLSKAARVNFTSIVRTDVRPYYPLSSAQKRLFVMSYFKGAEIGYNMYAAFRVDGELNVEKLEAAFQSLIARHESLRTSFAIVDDEPVQIIHDHVPFALNRIEGEAATDELIEAFVRQFDLSVAPLFRAQVLVLSPERHLIMFDMHHIIADGVSLDIFFRELWAMYDGRSLPPLAIQYKDYSAWQRSIFATEAIGVQRSFWKKQLEGELPILDLPVDHPRPSLQSFEGSNYRFDLDRHLVLRVFEFISQQGVTLNMFMLAVYNILLSKYSSQDDIIVGTPVAGRTHADLEPIIGMFVNTLALRNYPKGDKSFEQFLEEVKENALGAYENQDYPFEELIDLLNLKRDTSRNPLFDTMFLLKNEKTEPEKQVLRFTSYPIKVHVAKFDLTFEVIQSTEAIGFLVNYNTAMFVLKTIQRMAKHFMHIILQVLERPEMLLKQIQLPDQEELQRIKRFEGNVWGQKLSTLTIPGLWKKQVLKYPSRIALESGDERLSFEALDLAASELAIYLQKTYAVGKEDRVAIMLGRTVALPTALLAVLKAGATYVPIDPSFPVERIRDILDNSGCKVIIADQAVDHGLQALNIHEKRTIYQGECPVIDAGQTAYITYTSGSTGRPKGVMISHGNVVAFTENLGSVFGISAADKILAITNITFDISVLEIICSLIAGIPVVLAGDMEVNDFDKIKVLIERQKINVLQLTPSRLSLIFNQIGTGFIQHIKTLLVGGEAMPEELFHTLKGFKQTRVFNVYGPTETCIWSTADELQDDRITIGKPLSGEQVLILAEGDQPQAIRVAGEICIAGVGVGKGYYGNETLTAEKFFKDDRLASGYIYRTGDRGRWLPDGRIEYIGRMDNQVKLRGYRIELGEIENALCRLEDVKMAAVILTLVKGDLTLVKGEKQIIAFYESSKVYTLSAIRSLLANYLPAYMLPSDYIHLPAIPLTSSGKIDRKRLESMAQQHVPMSAQAANGGIHEEPVGALQKGLVAIWQEILNIEPISISANFFETGGNSIKLIQVLNKVRKELGIDLPLATAFKYTSIKELSAYINTMDELGKMQEDQPYTLVNPGKKQMIFCFPPLIGYSFLYTVLADYLPDHTLCCLHFLEQDDRMDVYLRIMNELQPGLPFVLLGYSVGGNLAFEVAKELESVGQEVSDIILIDSYKRWKIRDKTDAEVENDISSHIKKVDLSMFAVDAAYVASIKERVFRKMLDYAKFLNDQMDTGKTDARIHLIKCEEKLDNATRNRNWEDSTTNGVFVYQGTGMHPEMLNSVNLPSNASYLPSILQMQEAGC